jgi:hypothetical protein
MFLMPLPGLFLLLTGLQAPLLQILLRLKK